MVATLSALIVVRLLIGAAEAVVVASTYRHLASNFDETWKGTVLGIYSIGGTMGQAPGAPIARLADCLRDASGWRNQVLPTGRLDGRLFCRMRHVQAEPFDQPLRVERRMCFGVVVEVAVHIPP